MKTSLVTTGLVLMMMTGQQQGFGVQCIAHRGYSAKYQENSLEAIQEAWKAGADLVETDVQILGDGTVVLYHDMAIAKKKLASLTYSEVQALTPNHHVPKLVDALTALSSEHTLLLDLKSDSTEFVDRLLEEIQSVPEPRPVLLFQSRKDSVFERIAEKVDKPRLILLSSLNYEGPAKTAPRAEVLAEGLVQKGLHGITAQGRQFIDREFVEAFQKRGLTFYVWTINPPDRMRHYRDLGVDGVISDDPALLLKELRQADNDTP